MNCAVKEEFSKPFEAVKWTSEYGAVNYQVGDVYVPGELFELIFSPRVAPAAEAAALTKKLLANHRETVNLVLPPPKQDEPAVARTVAPDPEEPKPVAAPPRETGPTVREVLLELLDDGPMTSKALVTDLVIRCGCTQATAQQGIYSAKAMELIEQFDHPVSFGSPIKKYRLKVKGEK